ncbi:hypothetical protein [Helicobacter pylori]|uniref:hypothetical protein n=1 Tax=Helicobacter pylori TaxID=210 RepID=UPI001C5AB2B3|nr:hypothetical protein [Helicobacter pylori]
MAFFNIFKLNFLKPYYRTFSPNKGINFTPTIQLKRIFLRRVGLNALWTLKPCKIPIIGIQSQNQTLPNFNFSNH